MRYKNVIPALIIFSVFLLSGLLTGRWIGQSIEDLHKKSTSTLNQNKVEAGEQAYSRFRSFAPQSPANFQNMDLGLVRRSTPEQRNVLLIGVDHLGSPSPTLESIWLVLYIQDLPQITWMPIYPEITTRGKHVLIQTDSSLKESFQLLPDSLLPQGFQQALRAKHIHWDNLIILDQSAMAGVIDTLGGLERLTSQLAEGDVVDGLHSIAILQPANIDSQAALLSQANLIQQLCRTSPQEHINLTRLQNLLKTMSSHLVTDLEPEQVISDMSSMLLYGGGFTCEFPSLALLSSEITAPSGTK